MLSVRENLAALFIQTFRPKTVVLDLPLGSFVTSVVLMFMSVIGGDHYYPG